MKILVANRGEIAVRILRACREMGLPSVAVYSAADEQALHTRYADEAVPVGPAEASQSYLNIPAVIEAARKSGAGAVHPGYGFLSENAEFARAVEEAGLIFIGPRPETLALTGDKLAARKAAREAGLPVLPGPDRPLEEDLRWSTIPDSIRFPVLIKAIAGGGGRGIRLANTRGELEQMVSLARREAKAAFGDDAVYLEPLVQNARHIEVQILGAGRGCVVCLGERECSIQRRRQKLIEEAPSPGLPASLRQRLYDTAERLADHLDYRSLGTIEFLLDPRGDFHFIEVNPRIQVEHGVTEMVTGLDLVRAQIALAVEGTLLYSQADVQPRGWSIEARILAEDPEAGFLPATGTVTHLQAPGGIGVRVDSALYAGMPVTADYDSLLAKIIAWGETRPVALDRLRRALREFQLGGLPTDLEFLLQVIESEAFADGGVDTTFLDRFEPPGREDEEALGWEIALASALKAHQDQKPAAAAGSGPANEWQQAAWREQMGMR
ncbi:MAG TPA: biotin carboxylase N-terminal domain-containing protein [Anaerolineaceae bacterium]